MTVFYGTKRIIAEPQEKDGNHGYRVVYEDGYKSWSPQTTFEACYRQSGEMNFGHALLALNEGRRVARSGWNGRDQFLVREPGTTIVLNGKQLEYHAHIDIKTAQGTMAPYAASSTDLLAEDWGIVE